MDLHDCNIVPEFISCFDFTMEFHGYTVPAPDKYHYYLWGRVVLDELDFFCEAL
jgi:hypothetical protein